MVVLWRALLGLVAEIASRIPSLNKKFHIKERLWGPFPEGPFLWMHGASMGECKMLLGLTQALQEDFHNLPRVLLTTQKVEVVEYLQSVTKQDRSIAVALAPADVPWTLRNFLRKTQPVGLILGENELWPGYLSSVKRYRGKPAVALVSGRFRKVFPRMSFSGIGFATMQTSIDKDRFLNASRQSYLGDTYEGGDWKLLSWARGRKHQGDVTSDSSAVSNAAPTVVSFVSLHIEEMHFVERIIDSLISQGKSVVLIPRRLNEVPHFLAKLRSLKIQANLWPEASRGSVAIVNSFGQVHEILSRSESVFVGGSFHKKLAIHDFWEPLELAVPTFVGPYSRGHESAVNALVKNKALVRLSTPSDWPQAPADRTCVVNTLAEECKKILNSYALFRRFVEELLK